MEYFLGEYIEDSVAVIDIANLLSLYLCSSIVYTNRTKYATASSGIIYKTVQWLFVLW